jgi:hypothetical protein
MRLSATICDLAQRKLAVVAGNQQLDMSQLIASNCMRYHENTLLTGWSLVRIRPGEPTQGNQADRVRKPPKKGGILKAVLASPLVGSELDLTRHREEGRKVDI